MSAGGGPVGSAAALDDTVAAAPTTVPGCPFVEASSRGRGECLGGHTAPVRPEHLAAVPVPE